MQNFRLILFISLLFFGFSELKASSPPPINDTVCDATDLGVLDLPGPCPTYPYGDTVLVNGSTEWATYNTFDFSPVHCFPNSGAPDVWYKFRSTGSYIYLEMTGYNDLDSFFVKLFYTEGSCLSLVALTCETTTNGVLYASFLTPEVGGQYYLQIGGSMYDETGAFQFFMKSYNECNGCVKNADIDLSPAPWFGRYSTGDTVQMCVTVNRWELLTTSNLHSIIPEFGDDWDTTTLTPISAPGGSSSGWGWFNSASTPLGPSTGFLFDSDFNGNPGDNAGDPGNFNTSWTGCWSIATKPFCNTFNLSVDIKIYSDNETGNGNPLLTCDVYTPIHLGLAGWCCPSPIMTVLPGVGCSNSSTVIIDPVSPNSTDTFNIGLYDTAMHVYGYYPGVIGLVTIPSIPAGDYLIEVYNVSNTCISYSILHIDEVFEVDMSQVAIGCGPGSGSVIATPSDSLDTYTYVWPALSTVNWTDSLAFNLDPGFVTVQVTNSSGCTVIDSFYVTTLSLPGAEFGYMDHTYCNTADTIQVAIQPGSSGGIYTLVSPTASAITVNPTDGTISLNGSTLALPYWIHVKYSVGATCTASWIDSVQIVQQPAAPTPTSQAAMDWCIGNTAPVLSIAVSNGIPFWYDVQTTATAIGYSFNPPLTGSTTAGTYLYGVVYLTDLVGGCASNISAFSINAVPYPNVFITGSATICEGDTTPLSAIGSLTYQYSWSPAPTSGMSNLPYTTTSPSTSTSYTCSVTENGCTTTGVVNIVVQSAADCVFGFYNGFTPNGDNHNDTWIIEGADQNPGTTVTIYNRWGAKVWERTNYDNTTVVWDGKDDKGTNLPEGTYYYIITKQDIEPAIGWVELSR